MKHILQRLKDVWFVLMHGPRHHCPKTPNLQPDQYGRVVEVYLRSPYPTMADVCAEGPRKPLL